MPLTPCTVHLTAKHGATDLQRNFILYFIVFVSYLTPQVHSSMTKRVAV